MRGGPLAHMDAWKRAARRWTGVPSVERSLFMGEAPGVSFLGGDYGGGRGWSSFWWEKILGGGKGSWTPR